MAVSNSSHSRHHLPVLSTTAADYSSRPTLADAPHSQPSASSSSVPGASVSTESSRPGNPSYKHRPTASTSKSTRTGFFTFASLARDKTSSAIANLSESTIRPRPSSSNLTRQSTLSVHNAAPPSSLSRQASSTLDAEETSTEKPATVADSIASNISLASTLAGKSSDLPSPNSGQQSLLDTDPPSQQYEDTDSNTPVPTILPANYNKMHQTSSRLLRMTDDERPFTRDFKDLFATLVVSLPLSAHRVRLTRLEHTFLSEEAINNLGSLKFSQSNRMPDPKDPSRIVTTTTTTTFSMAKEMARSVCQRFLEARFIESADGKQARDFTLKGSVWQLTPKGICVLDRFCSKNGIQQKHITDLIYSSKNTMQLVTLERNPSTDKLSSDRSTIEVIFRRFIGQNGPNVKTNISIADSDSLSDYKDGLAGVKMASERRVGSPPRTVHQTFTGKAASDWLMDCCTTVDRRETVEIATLFIEQDLIWCVQADRSHITLYPQDAKFQPTKNGIYQMTQKGKDILAMTGKERVSHGDESGPAPRSGVSKDSNTQKLDRILNDAALRLLFRENLRDTHCEENLSFYLDVDEFLRSCKAAIKGAAPGRAGKPPQGLDAVKEAMASAYGIYNAFLAPGSPCELNIDHLLRNQLATRMTKAVGQDVAMIESLREVTKLFEEAQLSVFKLMASDSVPKFMKSSKYEQTLKSYDLDSLTSTTPPPKSSGTSTLPDRSLSRRS